MNIGLKRVMECFNLSVTQSMRDDYHNRVKMTDRDYLLIECEECAHGGRPVMFVAVSLVALYHCVMVVVYLSIPHMAISAIYGAGFIVSIFGMFLMATTGKADKPYYISDASYDTIMARGHNED